MLVLFLCVILVIGIVFSKVEIKILDLKISIIENDFFKLIEIFLKTNLKETIKEMLIKNIDMNIKIKVKFFGVIKLIEINLYKENNKYFIVLEIIGIKINITKKIKNIFGKIDLNRKFLNKTNNIINYIRDLNVGYSKTDLKIIFGTENTFFTSMIVPIITNFMILIFVKNKKSEIPKMTVMPSYNKQTNLKIYLKSNLKIYTHTILKILYRFLKQRKNNKYKLSLSNS